MGTRAAVLVVTLTACTGILPGVGKHDLQYDAATLAHERCDPTPVDPRLYAPALVRKVEPYYRYVMGGPNGRDAHLAGARLELQPLPGVTEELLARGLMCRSAEVMLGRVSPATNEPYALPDAWVAVEVKSGGGVFVVTLTSEEPSRAREVYDRARAFALPGT